MKRRELMEFIRTIINSGDGYGGHWLEDRAYRIFEQERGKDWDEEIE